MLPFASAKCLPCRREEAAKQPQSMTFGHGKRLERQPLTSFRGFARTKPTLSADKVRSLRGQGPLFPRTKSVLRAAYGRISHLEFSI